MTQSALAGIVGAARTDPCGVQVARYSGSHAMPDIWWWLQYPIGPFVGAKVFPASTFSVSAG